MLELLIKVKLNCYDWSCASNVFTKVKSVEGGNRKIDYLVDLVASQRAQQTFV